MNKLNIYFALVASVLLITAVANAGNGDNAQGQPFKALQQQIDAINQQLDEHNHDGVYQKYYAGVAVVAKGGGEYTDPITAMSDISTWCGTPSATNPCMLKIMPGVYDIGANSMQMQNYVDIEGSGENVTKIIGSGRVVSAIIPGQSEENTEIRFLTVESTSNSIHVISISNYYDYYPKFTHITVIGANGIYIKRASPIMNNITVIANNGRGIDTFESNAIINNAKITSSGDNYGILMFDSSIRMSNVTVTVNGSGLSFVEAIAVYFSSATLNNVTVHASGGTTNTGVQVSEGGVDIHDSDIYGSTYSVDAGKYGIAWVANTKLHRQVSGLGTIICAGVYDENYTFYANTCP